MHDIRDEGISEIRHTRRRNKLVASGCTAQNCATIGCILHVQPLIQISHVVNNLNWCLMKHRQVILG
jgi:hypothetical protein